MRLQNFKTVSEYNFALFKISFQLKLCEDKVIEEDILEKTFVTIHAQMCLYNSSIESVDLQDTLN